ncbi:MAG: EamA family transporter [Phycisphaerae bacterium]
MNVYWMGLLCLILAVLLETVGQLALKIGTANMPEDGWAIWKRIWSNRWIHAGIIAFVAEAVFWTWTLHDMPLIIAFPMGALCFVTVAIGSALILHEHISWSRWLGILLILAGVVLLGIK